METILIIILAALAISLASFAGAVFTAKFWKRIFSREQALIISFAAGVFLLLGIFLLGEAIELLRPIEVAAYLGGSLLLFHILSLVWPEHHHHHGEEECSHHGKSDKPMARRMLLSDSIHNIADGLILVPAFAIGIEFGLVTAFGIWLHELVQEIAEYAVLRQAGYSSRKALILNFLTSLTIFIGIIVALILVSLVHGAEGPLAAIAAGSFLYVSLKDLIPHSVRHSRQTKRYADYVLAMLFGAALMIILNTTFGHSHGGGHEHGHAHSEIEVHEDSHDHHGHEEGHHHDH